MISITVRHHHRQQSTLQASWHDSNLQVNYNRDSPEEKDENREPPCQQSSVKHHARSISLIINPKFNNQNVDSSGPDSVGPTMAKLVRRRSLPRRLRQNRNRNCRLVLANDESLPVAVQRANEIGPAAEAEGDPPVGRPLDATCPNDPTSPMSAPNAGLQFRLAGAWLRELSDQFSK